MYDYYLKNQVTGSVLWIGTFEEVKQYQKMYYTMLVDRYGAIWANAKLAELAILKSGDTIDKEIYI